MAVQGTFQINGHDYTQYVKQKTGFGWARENTSDSDAGRDEDDTMHLCLLTLLCNLKKTLKAEMTAFV